MELAFATPGCIELEVDEPDFSTPRRNAEAAAAAALTKVGYTPTTAFQTLRQSLN